MAFVKREIKDRVVQYPRRYQLVEVQPGIFDLIPVTGTVTEEGTPINKAYLQPIEDGLADALEKTGDGKDVIVTFTEASEEAHISSGEKLSTLFGKILKKFKNVAPKSHANSATTYGVGTGSNYGHCKTINNLTRTSFVSGESLAAYQGKVLLDRIVDIENLYSGSVTYSDSIPAYSTLTKNIPIGSPNKKRGRALLSRSSTNIGLVFFGSNPDFLSGFQRTGTNPDGVRVYLKSEGIMRSVISSSNALGISDMYINGSNIVIVFTNLADADSLNVQIDWEVW